MTSGPISPDEQLALIAEEVVDLQEELARLRRESDGIAQLSEQRDSELADREVSLSEAIRELADERAAVTSLQHQLGDREAALAERTRELAANREQLTALEDERTSLTDRAAEAHQPVTVAPAAPLERHLSHLRLIPLSTGYALSEVSEPPPRVGEPIDVDGELFSVTRVGRSPLPGDERPCAFCLSSPRAAG